MLAARLGFASTARGAEWGLWLPALTVYRIRDALDGDVTNLFDVVVDPDALDACEIHDYSDDALTARLYLPPTQPRLPRWAVFVRDGFVDALIGPAAGNRAQVVASVRWYTGETIHAGPDQNEL